MGDQLSLIGPPVEHGADLSDCLTYRWRLWRRWSSDLPPVNFVMLNPSTADATTDDPTIRRCVAFARSWGYGSIFVTNLFALRATDPRELRRHGEPSPAANDLWLLEEATTCPLVVAAWGNHGTLASRGAQVRAMLEAAQVRLHHLGLTKAGNPRHPLYLPGDTEPTPWNPVSPPDTASVGER